jgi:hypothetical protein
VHAADGPQTNDGYYVVQGDPDQLLAVKNAGKRLSQCRGFKGESIWYVNQVPLINKPSGDRHVFGIPSRYILPKSQKVVTAIGVTATAMETVPAAHRWGQCYPVADLEPVLSICFCYLP